jgi:hypothetical protein
MNEHLPAGDGCRGILVRVLLAPAEDNNTCMFLKRCSQFYGLVPFGVSSVFLVLLFPSFSLVYQVTEVKSRLLIRATRGVGTFFF